MHADDASAKPGCWPCLFVCLKMSTNSFWSSLAQAMGASLGTSSPRNLFTTLNKLGRSSLLMPDAGKLKCRCVSPNPRWLLNPPDYRLGKLASNSCSLLPSLMHSSFRCCLTQISSFTFFPHIAIEPESGAEISQLHFTVCALLFPAFGLIFALTPCLN